VWLSIEGHIQESRFFAQDKTNLEDGREIGIQGDAMSLHIDQGPSVLLH